jgi:hypothetical protein
MEREVNDKLMDRLHQIGDLLRPEHIIKVEELQDRLWSMESLERIPTAIVDIVPPDHPLYPHDQEFDDPEKMLWNQLLNSYVGVLFRDDRTFTVRAEYGPIMVPSLFGIEYHVDKTSSWAIGFNDRARIKKIIEKGLPDVRQKLTGKAMDTQAMFKGVLTANKLDRYIHVAQCDSQSPFDLTWMVWGDDLYYALVDDPELVHQMLELSTVTIIAFIEEQKKIIDFRHHWFYHIEPGIRVVDDSTISISPAMYEEFAKPYNERVFQAVGNNGYVHYCGHLLQNQHLRLHSKGLSGIEMAGENTAESVPDFNLAALWKQAYEHGIPMSYLSNDLPATRPDLHAGLMYILKNERRNFEEASAYYENVKAFWS